MATKPVRAGHRSLIGAAGIVIVNPVLIVISLVAALGPAPAAGVDSAAIGEQNVLDKLSAISYQLSAISENVNLFDTDS